MNVKSFTKILVGLCLMLSHNKCYSLRLEDDERQLPGPDISALRDDLEYLPNSDLYLPAVMQCLHYYTELMQYEMVQNPTQPYQDPIITTTRPRPTTTTTTTTRKTTTTTTTRSTTKTKRTTTTPQTTKRPTTTSSVTMPSTSPIELPYYTSQQNFSQHHPTTVQPHKPGVTAPNKPPYFIYFDIPLKPSQGYHKPGVQRPQVGINAINEPNWKDPAFFQWFFQSKPKTIETFDENELQYLDPLPKKLLMQIAKESNLPFAILDIDNVNEFRRNYDDSYYPKYRKTNPDLQQMRMKMKIQMQQKRQMLTGRKKAPPTRPYVHMLMLYDQLKKEAKEKKLHMFMGYSQELLEFLYETSKYTGDYQMKTLLQAMLDKQEVTTHDVLSRVNLILSDLENEKSETFRTLRAIPPLVFGR